MASGTTTVGSVKYDASIDLAQLRASTKEADKIVQKSYDNQAKAAKKSARSVSSGAAGTNTSGSSASEAQMRVDNLKRQAQETASALATYTPQIQKQFLTVERANNQVTNATERSFNAIQKYGAGSAQATSATNALNVAVGSQAQHQSKLTAMLDGTYKSQNNFASSMGDSLVAIGGVVAGIALLSTTFSTLQNSVKAANSFESSIAGLSRLSERFGYDAKDAVAAAQSLASDGLITVATAAEGLQKLLTAGVGLPEATELMTGYKDQAAFGKSSTIDFDTAVKNLAESFYTENSAIGNLSGQTENWSRILEYGAAALGKNVDSLSAKERVQAKLIGQQRLNNLVEGDSAALAQTSAANQARLEQTLKEVEVTIGRVTNQITGGLIGALGGMDEQGQKTAISVAAGTAAFAGFLTIVPLAITAFRTIRSALLTVGVASAFASGGITALVGGLAAVAAGIAVNKLIDKLDTTEELSDKFSQNVKEASGGLGTSATNAAKTAKQLAKINEQMQQAREDYSYSLAQLVREKNENIASLTNTLSEEKSAYDNALNERLTSFNKTQNEELLSHEQKTRALQNQIDFLSKYDTAANKKQLSELQFSLARENAEYQKSTELRKNEFNAQTESAKSEYEIRRAENEKKLNEEIALLEKHREEVLSIRGLMLRDEIEDLKYRRDQQLEALADQQQELRNTGNVGAAAYNQISEAAARAMNVISGANNMLSLSAATLQGTVVRGIQSVNDAINIVQGQSEQLNKSLQNSYQSLQSSPKSLQAGAGRSILLQGFSEGGFTGSGGSNQPAGIVHAGEYVLPKDKVNQVTGQPDWGKMGGSGTTVNVSLSLSGIMTSSKSDERAIATRIAKLINEAVKAKTGSLAIAGV